MGEHKYQVVTSERRSSQQTIAQGLFTKLSLGDDCDTPPSFFRRNSFDIAAFDSLTEDDNLMLFTPAVPNLTGEDMDPFEPFGRALAAYHKRVKHVPYTKDGFTGLHQAFLAYAGAVIIAIVEPMNYGDLSGQEKQEAQLSLRLQGRFGKTVLKSLADSGTAKPVILVICTAANSITEGGIRPDPDAFGTVLCMKGYDAATLVQAAHTIFEGEG